jgi:hypothetical protein
MRPIVTDSLGVTIEEGDLVRVLAWGAPVRLVDTGRAARVVEVTHRGLVGLAGLTDAERVDPIARGRNVSPGCLGVLRRDGAAGYEGNA